MVQNREQAYTFIPETKPFNNFERGSLKSIQNIDVHIQIADIAHLYYVDFHAIRKH